VPTTTFTCNGCGRDTAPSKEHLIHLAIGRVIFRNKQLNTDQLRERLNKGWLAEYRAYADPMAPVESGKPVKLDMWVRNLICKACNKGWAKTLEEETGHRLYNFVHGEGPVSDPLFRKWAWFFSVKIWRYYRRNEALGEGLLYPMLRPIAQDKPEDDLPPILVCRMQPNSRKASQEALDKRWRFGWFPGEPRAISFVLWGTAFFEVLPHEDGTPRLLPFDTVPLTDGLVRKDIPMVPRRQLSAFWTSQKPTDQQTDAS
jgi:hypothetical protein